jgi:hypothetical protein
MFHGLYRGGFVGDCGSSLKRSVKGVSRSMGMNSTATLLPWGEYFAKPLFYSNTEGKSDRLLGEWTVATGVRGNG